MKMTTTEIASAISIVEADDATNYCERFIPIHEHQTDADLWADHCKVAESMDTEQRRQFSETVGDDVLYEIGN